MKIDKALKDEILETINGGAIKQDNILVIKETIALFKKNNLDLDSLIQLFEYDYRDYPTAYSTTGSKEDHDKLVEIIKELWNEK